MTNIANTADPGLQRMFKDISEYVGFIVLLVRTNEFLDLLEKNKKTEKDMIMYLGISNGSFTPWKYQGSKSYMQYIAQMAEYFRVTPNYLLYGVDEEINTDTITVAELDLLRFYRKMKNEQKLCLMKTAELFARDES